MSTLPSKSLRPTTYFATHPVFTHEEFVAAHTATGRSEHTSNAVLAGHVAAGRLLRIRRGLYATVPPGAESVGFRPDPYLVATKLRPDAVVAYHAALAFHGKAHSVWQRHHFVTGDSARPLAFRGDNYVAVQAPGSVRALPGFGGGVVLRPHGGGEARVTTLERCLVDLMHSPEHGGGWEEILRSLETVEYFDLDDVVRYALLMDSALTVARVGWILEQHRDTWMVEEKHLAPLLQMRPRGPRYLSPRREPGKLVARWNLVVPEQILKQAWEEPA